MSACERRSQQVEDLMTSVGADAVLRLLHHPLVQFLLNVKSQRYAFEVERRFRTAAHRKTSRNGCL